MDFFKKVKSKLLAKKIAMYGGFDLLGLAMIAGGIALLIFDSDDDKVRISVRGFDFLGITIPAVLAYIFMIIVGIGLVFFITKYMIREIRENEEYYNLMDRVKKAGGADKVGPVLASLPKNKKVAKGELRFNEEYLFYMNGTDVLFLHKDDIKRIATSSAKDKNGTVKYYISINPLSFSGETFGGERIPVSRGNMQPLSRELSDTYGLNQN